MCPVMIVSNRTYTTPNTHTGLDSQQNPRKRTENIQILACVVSEQTTSLQVKCCGVDPLVGRAAALLLFLNMDLLLLRICAHISNKLGFIHLPDPVEGAHKRPVSLHSHSTDTPQASRVPNAQEIATKTSIPRQMCTAFSNNKHTPQRKPCDACILSTEHVAAESSHSLSQHRLERLTFPSRIYNRVKHAGHTINYTHRARSAPHLRHTIENETQSELDAQTLQT